MHPIQNALGTFIRYVSLDSPYDEMKANEYLTLSETLQNIPKQFFLSTFEASNTFFFHYAIHNGKTRKSPIPASGILSMTGTSEGLDRFKQNCGLDGDTYIVAPHKDALVLDAIKLAQHLHEEGKLEWRFKRRIEQENEYIYINPTIHCCKITTLG